MMAPVSRKGQLTQQLPLHLMLLPGVVLMLVFSYGPMFGIIMAFQKYSVGKGFLRSPWVGLKNFEYILQVPDFYQVLYNTVFISTMKIAAGLIFPVIIALLLNEFRKPYFKRSIQTTIYLPYFFSWVIMAGILIDILSPSSGAINKIIILLGGKPIFFLMDEQAFIIVLIISNIVKESGFGTIVYLAALTSIDPTYYEAAIVDGANRWKQTLHITLPGLKPILTLMALLSLGSVLNAGFDQIFNLYNPMVYRTGDILDTLVYRMGLLNYQYSLAAAVGLFKSIVSCILIVLAYKLAYRYAGYRIL